jgi:DNA-binding HxlR family transcriptional regulator
MKPYGQYCPISRAAEVLGDRWTIHIVRDLLTGTDRFNDLIRGNPGMSRALLTRRLRQLQLAGIVEARVEGGYALTDAGRDLEPWIFGMAEWGARWSFGDPDPDELDPDLLVWWLHRRLDTTRIGAERLTVHVQFTDHPRQFWIVADPEASVCLADPGFGIDVSLRSDRATLYRVYLGREQLLDARRRGDLELTGSNPAVRRFQEAFRPSPVEPFVAAQRPG